MSDDTPTQRFDQPAADGATPKKRGPLIPILIAIGALILIGIVVVVVLLVNRTTGTPLAAGTNSPIPSRTASAPAPPPAPSPTPSTSHTSVAPPPVQSTDPAFTLFQPDLSKYSCSSGPYYSGPTPILKVKYVTVRTASVWIVQGTSDAADSGFMQIPLSGDQSEFSMPLDLACDPASSTFTITLVGTNGKHVSKSWTVINDHPTG